MAIVKHHKVVAALPAVLEPDAIYYVRAGGGYDQYVTNSTGMLVAYPANYAKADDARLTNAREWTAETVPQAEAEQGTATTRRAWTAQRVFQAVTAWWVASAAKTKLDGIQAGATANATDAQLRARATHTGTQAISTVTGLQTALDNKINTTERGVSGGVATLDEFARIPASQLPSYVDDVLEYATTAQFPATGEGGKIYIAVNQGTQANPTRQYRWTGSVYAEINPSPGTTDALAEGSTNLYFSEHRVRNTVLTGLSLAASAAITAADTVLSALGKLQAQLGLKADLSSPTFTGDPKAPTPDAADNDTSIATTAHVKAAMGMFGLGSTVTANVTSLNDITTPGLWSTLGSGLTEVPPGFSSSRLMVLFWGTSTYGSQIAIEASSTNATAAGALMAFRRVRGGVWSEWVVNWHTGNLVKQTAIDDATAGSVLLTGAGGLLGQNRMNMPGNDFNQADLNGFYGTNSGAINGPLSSSGHPVLSMRYNNVNGAQITIDRTSGDLHVRAQAAGVWGPSRRYFHDGNFDPSVKADLNSPTLTGDPKAPTPAATDNDTSIATTAFVRAAMGLFGLNNPSTQQAWHAGNFDPATKQDKSTIITTATSRTLALTDAWNYVRPSTTGAVTLTVPTNASVAFDVGTEITVRALGNITLAAASGVTLNAPSGGTLSMTAHMTVTLKKVGANLWDVIGQTVPA